MSSQHTRRKKSQGHYKPIPPHAISCRARRRARRRRARAAARRAAAGRTRATAATRARPNDDVDLARRVAGHEQAAPRVEGQAGGPEAALRARGGVGVGQHGDRGRVGARRARRPAVGEIDVGELVTNCARGQLG